MKLNKIEMGPHYPGFGEGAVPGIKCELELQVGKRFGQTLTVELSHDQVRELVFRAVDMALDNLTLDKETIVITGTPGTPREPVDERVAVDAELL